ncbi:hypothetical protein PG994_011789 [Apiospora phragmitis]|uniref:Uncharacterized protein n=1 Tax=Apiospora phragmitis TaxID=2905665 RepID=A0ABR1TWH5_9PEZI
MELPRPPPGHHRANILLIPAHIDGLGDGLDGQQVIMPEEAVVREGEGAHEGKAQPAYDAADDGLLPSFLRHVSKRKQTYMSVLITNLPSLSEKLGDCSKAGLGVVTEHLDWLALCLRAPSLRPK